MFSLYLLVYFMATLISTLALLRLIENPFARFRDGHRPRNAGDEEITKTIAKSIRKKLRKHSLSSVWFHDTKPFWQDDTEGK